MLDQLTAVAESAPGEGLPLESARLARLAELRRPVPLQAPAQHELDAIADSLFARLAVDFAAGRVNPATVDPDWHIIPTTPDVAGLERSALSSGQVRATLMALLPQHAEYRALRDELARTLAEPAKTPGAAGFDRDARLSKLRAALERWRWMPHQLPAERIEVHVPEFHLVLMERDHVARTHRVVVGKTVNKTPSFAAEIRGVIFNPYWDPPASIMSAELAPKFRRDPNFAAREGFVVFDTLGGPVDPAQADWTRASTYHVRQRPGPANALGRVKLDMPNPYAIYLHDTPARNLFQRLKRTFSHGCIRVDQALTLAEILIGDAAWDSGLMESALSTNVETKVGLPKPLAIYVLYLTAGRADDGTITYVDDVYGRDTRLINALDDAGRLAISSPSNGVGVAPAPLKSVTARLLERL